MTKKLAQQDGTQMVQVTLRRTLASP